MEEEVEEEVEGPFEFLDMGESMDNVWREGYERDMRGI